MNMNPLKTQDQRIADLEAQVRRLEDFITKGLNHYVDTEMGKARMLQEDTLEETILETVENGLYIATETEPGYDYINYRLRRN